MSLQKTIFVTGATGNQGGGVVRHSLRHGHAVVALVRDPTSAASQTLLSLGATLAPGDLDDLPSLTTAIATHKPDAVFHMQPRPHPSSPAIELRQTTNVVTAARSPAHVVSTFILTTVFGADRYETFPGWGTPSFPLEADYWRAKGGIEEIVRGAGFENWTIVRPVYFLQLLTKPTSGVVFPGFDSGGDRVLRVAFRPETRVAWVDGADVGVVAARVVGDPGRYSGRGIDLAVEALTIGEVAARLGEVLGGEEVRVHYYTEEEAEEAGKKYPIGSHFFGNQVPSEGAVEASREFLDEMTGVEEFFARNRERI